VVVISLVLLWLRVAGLVGQAGALGGALLAVVVLRPGPDRVAAPVIQRARTLAGGGALLVAAAQASGLAALTASFSASPDSSIAELLGSTPGAVALLRIAVALAASALCLRGMPRGPAADAVLIAVMVLLAATGALASHAVGRVEGQAWLLAVGALHQVAAATWVGGIACAAVLLVGGRADESPVWLRPFSRLAAIAVVTLALTGIALSLAYVATPAAAIGTAYGTMVLTKVALFAAMLAMGAMNHRALHRGEAGAASLGLCRRIEVEGGLAVVMLAVAGSLASAPLAVDVRAADRVGLDEFRAVLAPRWPRFETPSLAELAAGSALDDPSAPRTPEDTAWSEFGHNVAGLFVLAMGMLAMLERTGRARWARHWPLLIIGLTAFVTWNIDPEGWQTGAVGFWQHLLDPEVVQHRLMLIVAAVFGLAEWWVHGEGRRSRSLWRYVFPVACIVGGVLLLSHTHEVNNPKSAFFMELTHLGLGLLSLVAGWARWLELRLPPGAGSAAGRLWGPALAVFGLVLIFYREG
jgi:putative copper resistance protein D